MLNLQKNYLEKYQQIYPENLEWNSIEYKLQLNLGNASVQLKKVYCVANPYLQNLFDRENKGMITSEVYIRPELLSNQNRIERVCQKGFQFATQEGLEFSTGQITGLDMEKQDQELLIVKICPRKSYPRLKEDVDENFSLPLGFDSIYYKDEGPTDIYKHRFRLFKKMQTLPLYLVQFAFNNVHEKKFKNIMCQNCNDTAAVHYCVTEKVYLCEKCDFSHHKDKISCKHERTLLKDKPILNFGFCQNHKQIKNEVFCRECNISMCMNCKIYGTHSQGPMRQHPLEKISDYFAQISVKIHQMDPNLEKRKDQFQELLQVLDNKINQINVTTVSIQTELTKMFHEALTSLQDISRKKLSYLISDQLEIRRQYDYIQWMESFLNCQFSVLPPNNFLASWTKHLRLRKDILNVSNIPAITEVQSDFRIQGKIYIREDLSLQDSEFGVISNPNRNVSVTEENPPQVELKKEQSIFREKLLDKQQK